MKGFNRNRETRLRTSNKQYGRRDEEKSRQKGMLNPDTADRYWRKNKRKMNYKEEETVAQKKYVRKLLFEFCLS